jgi:hypothetical protein
MRSTNTMCPLLLLDSLRIRLSEAKILGIDLLPTFFQFLQKLVSADYRISMLAIRLGFLGFNRLVDLLS